RCRDLDGAADRHRVSGRARARPARRWSTLRSFRANHAAVRGCRRIHRHLRAVRGQSEHRVADRGPADPGTRWGRGYRDRAGRRTRHLLGWSTHPLLRPVDGARRSRRDHRTVAGWPARQRHRLAWSVPVPGGDRRGHRCRRRADLPRDSPWHLRTSGGFVQTGRDFRILLSNRGFAGAVLVQGFVNAALFAYLSGATYVLQGIYGLSPQQYAVAFGLNSAGFMVFGYLAGRTSERWSVTGTLVAGLAMCASGALGLLAAGLFALPLPAVIVSLLVMVSGVAVTTPPATTLALADYPQIAGTASSLLGMARFAFGGVSAPLVGIAGAATMMPLGIVTTVSVTLAVTAFAALLTRRTAQPSLAAPASEHALACTSAH